MERQAREGWGSRVIDRLSADLRRDFPDMTGLSARNLKYMRALAETHPDRAFVQQVVARLPWGHVVRRMENVKDATRREWYARQSIEHGWSRNVLIHQIESNLYERQGKVLTNFSRTLPAVQSELADRCESDAGRIVNLSSILGSMTHHSTPGSPIYGFHVPAYNVSKAAVNAFTVQLAYELKDTKIKVNAAHPGWVKTDLGGRRCADGNRRRRED
jgi:NAD(P)-dependent dehydrogenase (short-subunit alcohol dehydrogenase family)